MAPPAPPLGAPLGGALELALLDDDDDDDVEEEEDEGEELVSVLSEPQAATVDSTATVASGATRVRRRFVIRLSGIRSVDDGLVPPVRG